MGLSYRKIVATVSDNGSNFVKCFKEFGIKINLPDQENEEDDGHADADDEEDIGIVQFPDTPEEPSFKLPNHIRCASHTLNLVATTDAAKGLKEAGISKLNHSTMGKCSALWAAAGKPKSSEIIKEITGRELRYPCATRWNSIYDSLAMIHGLKDCINSVMQQLKLPIFKENELEFISEYLAIMKPIAIALDKLQGEKECFYGCLLPTLLVTQEALSSVEPNDLRLMHCMPLLAAVVSGFKARFQKHLSLSHEVTDAVLATVSHPYFKLRWLTLLKGPLFHDQESLKSDLKNKLQKAVRKFSSVEQDSHMPCNTDTSNNDEFFKNLEGPTSAPTPNNKHDLEVLQYLQDTRTSLECLHRYPAVRTIFKRYNTALPSSAPVERLFSFAGMVYAPKRSRLTDRRFEQLVLLKANAYSTVGANS